MKALLTTYLKSNFQGADLGVVNFWGANLKGTQFKSAKLENANLFEANRKNANLLGANLKQTKDLTPSQVKAAKNWEQAIYSEKFRQQLGLP